MRRTRRSTIVVATACFALLVGACGDSGTSAEATAEADSLSTTASATPIPFEADLGRKVSTPAPGAVGIELTRMSLDHQDGFDRATFEFTGSAVPGWVVQYVDKTTQIGTFQPISVDGKSVLEVLIREAVNPFTSNAPPYGGPPTVTNVAAQAVSQVQFSAVSRSVTQAFIGLQTDHPGFQVSALENPTRIIVDVST